MGKKNTPTTSTEQPPQEEAKATTDADAETVDETKATTEAATAEEKCSCPTCVKKRKSLAAHPIAIFVAQLVGTMSLRDQYSGAYWINRLMYGTTVLSFVLSMVIGKFWICAYSIIAVGAVSLLAFTLNLRRRPNVDLHPKSKIPLNNYVPVEVNERYFQALNNSQGYGLDYNDKGEAKSARMKKLEEAAAAAAAAAAVTAGSDGDKKKNE